MEARASGPRDPSFAQRLRNRDLRIRSRGPTAYTLSSLVHYGVRAALGKRVLRDKEHILTEYRDETRKEYWKADASPDDFILGDNIQTKWILYEGKLQIGTDRDARVYMLERLAQRVSEFLPRGRGRVVEFGCGTGRNLFFLKRRFPELDLVGLELVPSTISSARSLSETFGLPAEFVVADVTQPLTLEPFDVAFTLHALEQMPNDFSAAVDNMLAGARKGAVFFEPVWERFPKDLLGLTAHFRRYNANYLDGLLSDLERRTDSEITFAEALQTVGNPHNHTVEIVVAKRAPA